MLNLLIVDDEKVTRESLRTIVDWKKFGIENVEVARNGLVGLEIAAVFLPDIVLCDVRMAKMNGIDFCEKLLESIPTCKIIFISGYSDKEYLKKAISLKAVDYLEKPVDIDVLEEAVSDAVGRIRNERVLNVEMENLKGFVSESLPYISRELVRELVKKNPDKKFTSGPYLAHFFKAGQNEAFTCVNVCILGDAGESTDAVVNAKLLARFAKDDYLKDKRIYAGFTMDNRLLTFIFPLLFDRPGDAFSGMVLELKADLDALLDGTFQYAVGVGDSVLEITDIHISFKQAKEAVNSYFYHGFGKVFYYRSSKRYEYIPGAKYQQGIREACFAGDFEEVDQILHSVHNAMVKTNDVHIEKIREQAVFVVNFTYEMLAAAKQSEPFDDEVKRKISAEMSNAVILDELFEVAFRHVTSCAKYANKSDKISRKANEIKLFILQNYADKGLSIKKISDKVYLSQNYACYLFKTLTGKTINDFLTEVRIEKSKELLSETRYKLYEIADRVGFTDPNYFSTLFKKYEKCSPSAFREKL